MYLRFPNARLHVHDLISSSRRSGGDAIVAAACDYGLIPAESATRIKVSETANPCQCMMCCKDVVDSYLKAKHANSKLMDLTTNDLFSNIQYEAQEYERTHNSSVSSKEHDCARFAPALFDLLLQQIHKYD